MHFEHQYFSNSQNAWITVNDAETLAEATVDYPLEGVRNRTVLVLGEQEDTEPVSWEAEKREWYANVYDLETAGLIAEYGPYQSEQSIRMEVKTYTNNKEYSVAFHSRIKES